MLKINGKITPSSSESNHSQQQKSDDSIQCSVRSSLCAICPIMPWHSPTGETAWIPPGELQRGSPATAVLLSYFTLSNLKLMPFKIKLKTRWHLSKSSVQTRASYSSIYISINSQSIQHHLAF